MSDLHVFDHDASRLRSLIASFAQKRLLVIGDMVADEYLIGRPTRIARDAPVLILDLDEERTVPGGATKVAVNARTLGAEVFLAGVVGDDLPGQRLRRAIADLSMHQEGLVTGTHRTAPTKTYIVTGRPQTVPHQTPRPQRIDKSDPRSPSKASSIQSIA